MAPGTPGLGSWYTDEELDERFPESVPVDNPLTWIRDLFTIENAVRFIAIAVGIILVGLAVMALLNSDEIKGAVASAAN